MRIGYLTHEPLPSAETSTEQLVWTVSMMARQGLEIDLIVPASHEDKDDGKSDPKDSIRRFYGSESDELLDRVSLVPVWRPPFVQGNVRRAVHDVTAPFHARRKGYDLVYTRDLYALAVTLTLGMPSVFETYRTDVNLLRRFAPFRRLVYKHPLLMGVVAHSRLAADYFVKAGVDSERVLVAHNGYSPSVMTPVQSKEEARRALGIDVHDRLVCYTGHVNPKKGVDIILHIARQVTDATFLIVGAIAGSDDERHFAKLIEDLGVSNVRLLPRVSPANVSTYLYAADCLIIPPTAGPLERFHRTVLPMKTYLYLASGRPIVAPDLPDLGEILEDGKNAVLVPPDDVDACAAALTKLISDPHESDRLGSQARDDANLYTWEKRGGRIAEFLRARMSAPV